MPVTVPPYDANKDQPLKKYLDQIKNAAGDVTQTVATKLESTYTGAQDAVGQAKDKALSAVADVKHSASSAVDSTYTSTRDSVLDAKDKVVGSVTGVVDGVAGVATTTLMLAMLVGPFVAPVPTLIGAVMLLIIGHEMDSAGKRTKRATKEKLSQRKYERAVTLLQKYGKIPETALLESECVRLVINARTNEVTGTILVGQHEGQSINELSASELDALEAHAPDKDTKKILSAYRSFLDAQG